MSTVSEQQHSTPGEEGDLTGEPNTAEDTAVPSEIMEKDGLPQPDRNSSFIDLQQPQHSITAECDRNVSS